MLMMNVLVGKAFVVKLLLVRDPNMAMSASNVCVVKKAY